MDFWETNQPRYQRYEQQIQGLIPYEEHIRLMVDFYGEEKAQFRMIPAPLFSRVSFGPQLKTDEGMISHFITAFNSAENGQPAFSADLLRELIFHEFGHSFVNPVCETYRTEIFAHEHLFAYLKADMSAIAYPDWFPTVHEHIVRAGESLLLEQAGYLEEARQNEISNLRLGFALLPLIREKLACYAQNRDRYPSFRSFFPELLKLFAEVEAVECQKPLRLGLHIKREGERYIVRQIQAESAGAQAGFQVGDALLAVNGIALNGETSLKKVEDLWYRATQGDRVRFSIEREHKLMEFYVEVPFVTKYEFEKTNNKATYPDKVAEIEV
jgi:hypothetical protein